MSAAWETYRAGEVPKLIEPRMSDALGSLAEAVDARDAAQAQQAAIDASQWSLDLQLRYRPQTEIDRARFDLWAARLTVDAAAGDAAAVNGDLFTTRLHTGQDPSHAGRRRRHPRQQRARGAPDRRGRGGPAAASDAAKRLRDILEQHQVSRGAVRHALQCKRCATHASG